MTPYERVYNRLQGKPVDRAPNLNILMAFGAAYAGIAYDKYCQDFRYLVEANLKCNEYFGIDMLNTMSDPFREAYDFGAKIEFPPDALPISKKNLITDVKDIGKLKIFDPMNSTRMLDRIRAIELYKREAGNHYSILGWVEGAFAEAADLRGMGEIMVDIYDEPAAVHELISMCCEQGILCAKEQIGAGADFIGVGDAAASLVSPSIYREFVLPYEQKLFSEIHKAGGKVKLHVCGNITHLIEDMVKAGADIIDVDHMVDFKRCIKTFKDHACVNGNFDPVGIVYQGNSQLIRESVKICLEVSDETTFISAGCEIPRNTPIENLRAVHEALSEFVSITPGCFNYCLGGRS